MSHTTDTKAKIRKPIQSYRVQQRFWLDIARPLEDKLNREIEKMKQNRTFASTMRDALRLIVDLREGKVDVLCELFPWIAERLNTPVVVQPASDEFNQIMVELNRLRNEISLRAEPVPALPLPGTSLSLTLTVDTNADTQPMRSLAVATESRQNFAESFGDMFGD